MFSRTLRLAPAFAGLVLLAVAARSLPATTPALPAPVAMPGALNWPVGDARGAAVLSVSAPDGRVWRFEFPAGGAIRFPLVDGAGAPLADGDYAYELRFAPKLTPAALERLRAARAAGTEAATTAALRREGLLPDEQSLVTTGAFRMQAGAPVLTGAVEPAPAAARADGQRPGASVSDSIASPGGVLIPADQVIADDLIVQGSFCTGFDCVNGEPFGFDTIRLKENNTRILFYDTSTGTFPANHWMLTANDSANGGQNKFSIEDITGAKVPFTVTAAAPTNSFFMASNGKIGFRTATPVLDLQIATSDTPAIRLEQTNAGGFTPQTWDVAGNEANFFIRDVTGGSLLPFRIRPGAPTSSLDINANGNLGLGTGSAPNRISVSNGAYLSNGGVWTNASSRAFKDAIAPLDGSAALAAFGALSPVTYTYKTAPGESHVGFIAEDVPDLVATPDRRGLSSMDLVALLTKVVQIQQDRLEAQGRRLDALEQRCPAK